MGPFSKKAFGIPFSFSVRATRYPDGLAAGFAVLAAADAVIAEYLAVHVPETVGSVEIANPFQPPTGCCFLGFGY